MCGVPLVFYKIFCYNLYRKVKKEVIVMRDLKVLENKLTTVNQALTELYEMANKNHTSIYNAEINKLLRERDNLYININQEKQKRGV